VIVLFSKELRKWAKAPDMKAPEHNARGGFSLALSQLPGKTALRMHHPIKLFVFPRAVIPHIAEPTPKRMMQ